VGCAMNVKQLQLQIEMEQEKLQFLGEEAKGLDEGIPRLEASLQRMKVRQAELPALIQEQNSRLQNKKSLLAQAKNAERIRNIRKELTLLNGKLRQLGDSHA